MAVATPPNRNLKPNPNPNLNLSYQQLFSFQVSCISTFDRRACAGTPSGFFVKKKGEWKRVILVLDVKGCVFLIISEGKIILSQSFDAYRRYANGEDYVDNLLIYLQFKDEQWEIVTQNVVERRCLEHLLQCVIKGILPEEAVKAGINKGIIGLVFQLCNGDNMIDWSGGTTKEEASFLCNMHIMFYELIHLEILNQPSNR
eukprot:Gb_08156 [translate_table: standard]